VIPTGYPRQRVSQQGLIPTVKDGKEADVGAEALRIWGYFQ
jgi:hypothetical protein